MSLDALFEQLKHPNPNLRDRAMVEIADQRDETTIPRLMVSLDDEDITFRRAAVKVLGLIGMDAIPALSVGLAQSTDPTVKASCAKAMAQLASNYPNEEIPAETIAALKLATSDENPMVNITAVMALGQMKTAAFEPLTEILKENDNVAVAVAIVNALGSSGDERAIAVLKNLAADESQDAYVRESAVSALPRLDQIINYQKSGY